MPHKSQGAIHKLFSWLSNVKLNSEIRLPHSIIFTEICHISKTLHMYKTFPTVFGHSMQCSIWNNHGPVIGHTGGIVRRLPPNSTKPPFPDHISSILQGNSCKIGNTRLLGTSKNQNHQLCELCHFCLIFTLQQYIVAQKLIRQPYCSFNQHFVAS